MASEGAARAPLPPPPSGCASPVRRDADDGTSSPLLLQRPFTASGARKTRLVGVFVHWGERLDRLAAVAEIEDGDDGAERQAPSTYVALRTTRQTQDAGEKIEASHRAERDDPHQSYELRSSPFATTRVVERSAHPMWNEQLLVALPIEDRRQQTDAWVLHVDVVRRDPSQQEDALLATVALPLTTLLVNSVRRPRLVAIDLVPLSTEMQSAPPRLHLSLTDAEDSEDPDEVLEVVLEDIGADPTGASLDPTETQLTDAVAAIVVLSTAPKDPSHNNVRDLFKAHHANSPSPDACVWITPTAKPKRVDNTSSDRRLRWQFPMMFCCRSNGVHNPSVSSYSTRLDQLHAYIYSIAPSGDGLYAFECICTTTLELSSVPLDATTTSVSAALSPRQFLRTTMRRWDTQSWAHFQRTSVSRRVITTNRRHRKRAALQALEWTGALCRGLNRYPISSFCDEGGLSGLLARYLAASSDHETRGAANGEGDVAAMDVINGVRQPEDLLNQHIHLLQQEVMAKQETIQKLQRDVDASMTALRKCGAELVAARKEVRARDDVVTQLQTKLRELEQREADQTQELLAATGGMSSLRLDSHGAQRLNMLIFKYKELEQRHVASTAELADAKRAVATMEHLERKYTELEQAHVVQAGLVQRLQQDKARHGELQRTIRIQEKVIRKLEKAVTLQPQPQPQLPTVLEANATVATQRAAAADADSPLLAMRVQVLEQQLQTNAKAAASEIGRLKMRVMELETQLSTNNDAAGTRSPIRRPER